MIAPSLHRVVRDRASNRCEYCHFLQEHDPFYTFHVEHIIPRQHGGSDDLSNLALACHHCNLHKGPNLSGIDAETGSLTALFHPRLQNWLEHFVFEGALVRGISATGRVTIVVLAMNAPVRVKLHSAVLGAGGSL